MFEKGKIATFNYIQKEYYNDLFERTDMAVSIDNSAKTVTYNDISILIISDKSLSDAYVFLDNSNDAYFNDNTNIDTSLLVLESSLSSIPKDISLYFVLPLYFSNTNFKQYENNTNTYFSTGNKNLVDFVITNVKDNTNDQLTKNNNLSFLNSMFINTTNSNNINTNTIIAYPGLINQENLNIDNYSNKFLNLYNNSIQPCTILDPSFITYKYNDVCIYYEISKKTGILDNSTNFNFYNQYLDSSASLINDLISIYKNEEILVKCAGSDLTETNEYSNNNIRSLYFKKIAILNNNNVWELKNVDPAILRNNNYFLITVFVNYSKYKIENNYIDNSILKKYSYIDGQLYNFWDLQDYNYVKNNILNGNNINRCYLNDEFLPGGGATGTRTSSDIAIYSSKYSYIQNDISINNNIIKVTPKNILVSDVVDINSDIIEKAFSIQQLKYPVNFFNSNNENYYTAYNPFYQYKSDSGSIDSALYHNIKKTTNLYYFTYPINLNFNNKDLLPINSSLIDVVDISINTFNSENIGLDNEYSFYSLLYKFKKLNIIGGDNIIDTDKIWFREIPTKIKFKTYTNNQFLNYVSGTYVIPNTIVTNYLIEANSFDALKNKIALVKNDKIAYYDLSERFITDKNLSTTISALTIENDDVILDNVKQEYFNFIYDTSYINANKNLWYTNDASSEMNVII